MRPRKAVISFSKEMKIIVKAAGFSNKIGIVKIRQTTLADNLMNT